MGDLLPARIFETSVKPMHGVGKRQNSRFTAGVAHGEPVFIPGQRDRLALAQISLSEVNSAIELTSSAGAAVALWNLISFRRSCRVRNSSERKSLRTASSSQGFETQPRRVEIQLDVVEQVAELFIDAHLLGVFL